MRPPRFKFTIRWLMETTAIVAIALWLLRSPAAAVLLIVSLVPLYHYGLAPMRRLYGFSPVHRFFVRWAWGHLPLSPDGRTRDDGGMWQG
jgi:hypothetical protein